MVTAHDDELFIAPQGTTTLRLRYRKNRIQKITYRAIPVPVDPDDVKAAIAEIRKIADRNSPIQDSLPDLPKVL